MLGFAPEAVSVCRPGCKPHFWHRLRREAADMFVNRLLTWYANTCRTFALGHDGAGTAEDADTAKAAEGTDDDSEEESEEVDEADGTAVDAALNVSLQTFAVYALRKLRQLILQGILSCGHLADSC